MEKTIKTAKATTTNAALPFRCEAILDHVRAAYGLPDELRVIFDYTQTPNRNGLYGCYVDRTPNQATRRQEYRPTVYLFLKGVKDTAIIEFIFAHELGHAVDWYHGTRAARTFNQAEAYADTLAEEIGRAFGLDHPATLVYWAR